MTALLKWIAQSLAFWLILLPLLNLNFVMLWYFWLNPAGVVDWLWQVADRFYLFLLPVLTLVALLAWRLWPVLHGRLGNKPFWPVTANAVLFVLLLLVGELFKDVIIVAQAKAADADCLHVHSLLHSIMGNGLHSLSHAYMLREGQLYFWSYSELAFVEAAPRPYYECSRA